MNISKNIPCAQVRVYVSPLAFFGRCGGNVPGEDELVVSAATAHMKNSRGRSEGVGQASL